MFTRIKNSLALNRVKRQSRQQEELLCARFPFLRNYHDASSRIESRLRNEHGAYTASVSSPEMAVSLNSAILLTVFCENLKPMRLLDTGSGFSSYVLRSYAATTGAEVFSVDDNEHWLEKTREFLKAHNVSSDNVMNWKDFSAAQNQPFDLIFHDLGSMPTRSETLGPILNLTKGGSGILFLDDMHKPDYERFVRRTIKNVPCGYWEATAFTLDELGRWAAVVADLK